MFFVFKFVTVLLLVVGGGTVCLPMLPSWLEVFLGQFLCSENSFSFSEVPYKDVMDAVSTYLRITASVLKFPPPCTVFSPAWLFPVSLFWPQKLTGRGFSQMYA